MSAIYHNLKLSEKLTMLVLAALLLLAVGLGVKGFLAHPHLPLAPPASQAAFPAGLT